MAFDAPVCLRCGGASGHHPIPGEGALVCIACVYREGRLAGDPVSAPLGIVADTWEAHEDVVELVACVQHGNCWAWTRRWPSTHDLTLVSGVVL